MANTFSVGTRLISNIAAIETRITSEFCAEEPRKTLCIWNDRTYTGRVKVFRLQIKNDVCNTTLIRCWFETYTRELHTISGNNIFQSQH